MVKHSYLNAMAYATKTSSRVNESDMQRLLNILRLSKLMDPIRECLPSRLLLQSQWIQHATFWQQTAICNTDAKSKAKDPAHKIRHWNAVREMPRFKSKTQTTQYHQWIQHANYWYWESRFIKDFHLYIGLGFPSVNLRFFKLRPVLGPVNRSKNILKTFC